MKKIITIIIATFIIIFLISSFIKKQTNIMTSPPQSVITEIAQLDSLPQKNTFGALIKNSEEAIISAQLGGNVQKIYVKEGEKVKKGQLLVSISAPEIVAQYTRADKGVQIAQEQEKRARRKWDDYKPEEREEFKLQTEQYRAIRAGQGALLSKLKIVAPFDGIVSKKYVTEGETVMAGSQIVYVVGDTNYKEIIINVSNSVGNTVSVGDTVKVYDDKNKVDAKIIAISPVSDSLSRKVMLRIKLEDSAPFELGTFVNIDVFNNKPMSGIKILKESIINQYNDTFVFVVENEKVKMKSINIVTESDGFAIVRGIDEGDEVVVSGAHDLQDDESVKVIKNNF